MNNKNKTQVAIFYNPNSSYSASLRLELKYKFEESGGKVIGPEKPYSDLSDPNFDAQKALNTEEFKLYPETAIILIPDAQVTNALENARAVIEANEGRHLIGGFITLYNQKTLDIKNFKSLEKLILLVAWHPSTSPNKEFVKDATQLWKGIVSPVTALSYDAARALIEAIENQNNPTRQGVQKALSNVNFSADGATGKIEFEQTTHNRKNPPSVIVKVISCNNSNLFVPIEQKTCP